MAKDPNRKPEDNEADLALGGEKSSELGLSGRIARSFINTPVTPMLLIGCLFIGVIGLLFTPRQAWWFEPRRVIGGEPKGSMGTALFTAPNPPHGTVFTDESIFSFSGMRGEVIDLQKEKNFFETRVTEYQTGGALSWD